MPKTYGTALCPILSLLAVARDPVSPEIIALILGEGEGEIRMALASLELAGRVRTRAMGAYEIVPGDAISKEAARGVYLKMRERWVEQFARAVA